MSDTTEKAAAENWYLTVEGPWWFWVVMGAYLGYAVFLILIAPSVSLVLLAALPLTFLAIYAVRKHQARQ